MNENAVKVNSATADIPQKKKSPKKIKIIAITAAILLLIAAVSVVCISIYRNNTESKSPIAEVSLEKILEIEELSTVDYTYNATVAKYSKDNPEEVEYYVAYEGTVTAGIDFKEIKPERNDNEKTITLTLPEIEIQSIRVDMGTMEYIFVKNEFETETISQEAYKLCKNDLKNRIEKEDLLYTTARENAISSVEALFKPWVETGDDEYKVIIK